MPTPLPPPEPEMGEYEDKDDVSEPSLSRPRPSSMELDGWADDVTLNPHTLPRTSLDISPITEQGADNPSHQPAETEEERSPEKLYPPIPPLYPHPSPVGPSAHNSSSTPTTATKFPCTFTFSGCDSVFASKDYWKRHVANNHMCFVYWECILKPCPRPLFNTANFLEEHLKWVHEAPDHEIADLVRKGERPGRGFIEEIQCPTPGCVQRWKGVNESEWDDRMEHVAKHYEAIARGDEAGGWTEEGGGLLEWAIREGAVTEVEGRLMWTEPLGSKQPKEANDEREIDHDEIGDDVHSSSNASEPSNLSMSPSHWSEDLFNLPNPVDPITHQKTDHGDDDDVDGGNDGGPVDGRISPTTRRLLDEWKPITGEPSTTKGEESIDHSGVSALRDDTDPTTARERLSEAHQPPSPTPPTSNIDAELGLRSIFYANGTRRDTPGRRSFDDNNNVDPERQTTDLPTATTSRTEGTRQTLRQTPKRTSELVRSPSSRSTRDRTESVTKQQTTDRDGVKKPGNPALNLPVVPSRLPPVPTSYEFEHPEYPFTLQQLRRETPSTIGLENANDSPSPPTPPADDTGKSRANYDADDNLNPRPPRSRDRTPSPPRYRRPVGYVIDDFDLSRRSSPPRYRRPVGYVNDDFDFVPRTDTTR